MIARSYLQQHTGRADIPIANITYEEDTGVFMGYDGQESAFWDAFNPGNIRLQEFCEWMSSSPHTITGTSGPIPNRIKHMVISSRMSPRRWRFDGSFGSVTDQYNCLGRIKTLLKVTSPAIDNDSTIGITEVLDTPPPASGGNGGIISSSSSSEPRASSEPGITTEAASSVTAAINLALSGTASAAVTVSAAINTEAAGRTFAAAAGDASTTNTVVIDVTQRLMTMTRKLRLQIEWSSLGDVTSDSEASDSGEVSETVHQRVYATSSIASATTTIERATAAAMAERQLEEWDSERENEIADKAVEGYDFHQYEEQNAELCLLDLRGRRARKLYVARQKAWVKHLLRQDKKGPTGT